MSGRYRRFEVRQSPPAPPGQDASCPLEGAAARLGATAPSAPPGSPPPAEISNISSFSKRDPSSSLPPAMETFSACPPHMQDGLDKQIVGTTCMGEVGEAPTHRETPASPVCSAPVPRGNASERHAADLPPAKVANSANPRIEISTISNFSRSTELNTSAAGTLPTQESPLEAQEPTQYWSETLQAAFWVCATATHAAAFRTEGQVAYLPDEIELLRDLQACDPLTFPAKLRVIHQAKKAFGAVIASLEQVAARDMSPARPSASSACHACGGTRRWQSIYGVLICAQCHPPASPELVEVWEGAAGATL